MTSMGRRVKRARGGDSCRMTTSSKTAIGRRARPRGKTNKLFYIYIIIMISSKSGFHRCRRRARLPEGVGKAPALAPEWAKRGGKAFYFRVWEVLWAGIEN